jgi:ribonuclease Z
MAELMALHESLEGHSYGWNLVGVEAGARVPLRRNLMVHAHPSWHRVPSLAWEVVEVRHKLRRHLVGKAGEEIAAIRARGEEVNEKSEVSLFYYSGDTDRTLLEEGGAVFRSDVLLLECSFTREEDRYRGQQYQHIHLQDIYDFADRFENRMIILTHFTLRESPGEIRERIAATAPAVLRDRLHVALPQNAIAPEQQRTHGD